MVSDLQPGEVVVAEKIDRISRLPLSEAELLVRAIGPRVRGSRCPGSSTSRTWPPTMPALRIVLEAVQGRCCCASRSRPRATTTRRGESASARASRLPRDGAV